MIEEIIHANIFDAEGGKQSIINWKSGILRGHLAA